MESPIAVTGLRIRAVIPPSPPTTSTASSKIAAGETLIAPRAMTSEPSRSGLARSLSALLVPTTTIAAHRDATGEVAFASLPENGCRRRRVHPAPARRRSAGDVDTPVGDCRDQRAQLFAANRRLPRYRSGFAAATAGKPREPFSRFRPATKAWNCRSASTSDATRLNGEQPVAPLLRSFFGSGGCRWRRGKQRLPGWRRCNRDWRAVGPPPVRRVSVALLPLRPFGVKFGECRFIRVWRRPALPAN